MLPHPYRLLKNADFAKAKKGNKAYSPFFIFLKYSRTPTDKNPSRFGFVTSKKVGGAVERNRARRLLRHAVATFIPTIVPGFDIVIIASPKLVTASFDELKNALQKMLPLTTW